MSPMNSPHATAIRKVLRALRNIFGAGYVVDSQLPMSFSLTTEPQPDVSVTAGDIETFAASHPRTAELLVEIADTTLHYDRTKKASLYAKNKIQDYWIVNVKNRRVEIYRRPIKDKTQIFGCGYAEQRIYTEKDSVSPLAAPKAKIKVADLLP